MLTMSKKEKHTRRASCGAVGALFTIDNTVEVAFDLLGLGVLLHALSRAFAHT